MWDIIWWNWVGTLDGTRILKKYAQKMYCLHLAKSENTPLPPATQKSFPSVVKLTQSFIMKPFSTDAGTASKEETMSKENQA